MGNVLRDRQQPAVQISHTHTHTAITRLLFLCSPKCVRGITAAGIKKGLNVFVLKA